MVWKHFCASFSSYYLLGATQNTLVPSTFSWVHFNLLLRNCLYGRIIIKERICGCQGMKGYSYIHAQSKDLCSFMESTGAANERSHHIPHFQLVECLLTC